MTYTTKYNIIHSDKVIAINDTARQALNSAIIYITKCNDYVPLLNCNNVEKHHVIIAKLSAQLLLNGVLIINTKSGKKIKIIEI